VLFGILLEIVTDYLKKIERPLTSRAGHTFMNTILIIDPSIVLKTPDASIFH